MSAEVRASSADQYNQIWRMGLDYARYNPGGRHRRRLILRMLTHVQFSTLLDVGCGNGLLLQSLRQEFPRISASGADLSSVVIEHDKQEYPEMSFYQLDIQTQVPPRQFDLVTCSEVIEHLNDCGKALGNLASGIKPGGHLLLTFPLGTVYPTDRYFGHTVHPTLEGIRALSKSVGLEIQEEQIWGWPFLALYRWAINRVPNWSVQKFAAESYGPGKRLAAQAVYILNHLNITGSRRGCQALVLLRKPAS